MRRHNVRSVEGVDASLVYPRAAWSRPPARVICHSAKAAPAKPVLTFERTGFVQR